MQTPQSVLFVTSEVHPLIKTGGLADVSQGLPVALKRAGLDVRLLLPAYRRVKEGAAGRKPVAQFDVPDVGPIRLLHLRLPQSTVPVYLVDLPQFFDRDGNPYVGPDGRDWPDNAERYAAFCRAAAALAQDRAGLSWRPQIVHCNDWQTGLVPALLSRESPRPATVFTVHNLAYQGLFPAATFQRLRLPPELWSHQGLEFHDRLSFIKGGLVYADRLTTVSPTYAREILGHQFGYGLEGLLQHRSDSLSGILNGVDYDHWNPGTDPYIPSRYNSRDLDKKAANKGALQQRFGLAPLADAPLLAMVGRLVEQKGFDLVLAALPGLLKLGIQLVIVGSGERELESAVRAAAAEHPAQVAAYVGYSEDLAHLAEAGADIFLMPSRFEPCGLNQIYSLRYGTVPVVHRIGGLADTVIDATPTALAAGQATGFVFDRPESAALEAAVARAVALYRERVQWQGLMLAGMHQNFSWANAARQYVALYQQIL